MKKLSRKRLLFTGILLCQIFSSTNTCYAKSIEDIKIKWKELKPKYNYTSKYIEKPTNVAPYAPGKLNLEFLKDGINSLNLMRYLADIPCDVELDNALNEQSQYGATLLASTKVLSHYPTKPDDMSLDFYTMGKKSTSSSNIAMGYYSLNSSIAGYMNDSDNTNINRVGHRRWILNPQMRKTGFGYSDEYSTMYSFDSSRPDKFSYDFISWPSKYYFPSEYFDINEAWSVSLNTEIYDNSKKDNIKVFLTRKSDNKTWEFSKSDINTSGKYFNVETSGYGIPFCIIFRPNDIGKTLDNETFTVNITGLYDKKGNSKEITYTTQFFRIENKMVLVPNNKFLYINNVQEELDPGRETKPIIVNNRVIVPIRQIIEKLGGTVNWNDVDSSANIKLNNQSIKLWINSTYAEVNGSPKNLDVPAQVINDRTMLPLRFVIENLDCNIIWDEKNQTIQISW